MFKALRKKINSLRICVEGGFWQSQAPSAGQFQYGGDGYHLWVACPKYERSCLKRDNGENTRIIDF